MCGCVCPSLGTALGSLQPCCWTVPAGPVAGPPLLPHSPEVHRSIIWKGSCRQHGKMAEDSHLNLGQVQPGVKCQTLLASLLFLETQGNGQGPAEHPGPQPPTVTGGWGSFSSSRAPHIQSLPGNLPSHLPLSPHLSWPVYHHPTLPHPKSIHVILSGGSCLLGDLVWPRASQRGPPRPSAAPALPACPSAASGSKVPISSIASSGGPGGVVD